MGAPIAVCLGGLRGLLVDWDNPSFGLGCSLTLLHGASVRYKAHSRVQREECHLWALPPFSSSTSCILLFLFSFSVCMSVKLKLSRAFNRRVAHIWEGDYHFDGFAWMRCFMTVSERNVDAIFWEGTGYGSCLRLFCGDQTCVVFAVASSQRWDLALTPSLQGEARSWLLRYWPPLLCRSAVLASACDFQSPRL